MNARAFGYLKIVGNKVILHSREDLDNVSSLSTDVEVIDCSTIRVGRLRANSKCVRP